MSGVKYNTLIDTLILKIFEKESGEGDRFMIVPVDAGGEYLGSYFADTEEGVEQIITTLLQADVAETFVKLWKLTIEMQKHRLDKEFRHKIFAEKLWEIDAEMIALYREMEDWEKYQEDISDEI